VLTPNPAYIACISTPSFWNLFIFSFYNLRTRADRGEELGGRERGAAWTAGLVGGGEKPTERQAAPTERERERQSNDLFWRKSRRFLFSGGNPGEIEMGALPIRLKWAILCSLMSAWSWFGLVSSASTC